MNIVISDQILAATCMAEIELKKEIAAILLGKEKLTFVQASRLVEMNRIAFQYLLAKRQIPVHYGVDDFEKYIKNLQEMDRL